MTQNDFSIEVSYGSGTEDFTPEMKAAIKVAADTWEDAILQSNFEEEHTLEIEVIGKELAKKASLNGTAPIAQAIFTETELDPDNNNLPTAGASVVNTSTETLQELEEDPEQFSRVMIHEFGHVMGIGTLWEENDLIDPITGVYHSDTNAGEAFNRIYKTDRDIDIPLSKIDTNGEGEKVFAHWDERSFGNELMSPQIESSAEVSMPLSEITLASLEDIGWNVVDGAAEAFPDSDTNASLGFI